MSSSRCSACAPVCKCSCGAPAMHVDILGENVSTGRCVRCNVAVSEAHGRYIERVQRAEVARARAAREATTKVIPIAKGRRGFEEDPT